MFLVDIPESGKKKCGEEEVITSLKVVFVSRGVPDGVCYKGFK